MGSGRHKKIKKTLGDISGLTRTILNYNLTSRGWAGWGQKTARSLMAHSDMGYLHPKRLVLPAFAKSPSLSRMACGLSKNRRLPGPIRGTRVGVREAQED